MFKIRFETMWKSNKLRAVSIFMYNVITNLKVEEKSIWANSIEINWIKIYDKDWDCNTKEKK